MTLYVVINFINIGKNGHPIFPEFSVRLRQLVTNKKLVHPDVVLVELFSLLFRHWYCKL